MTMFDGFVGIDGDRRLVGGVPDDVRLEHIDVDLDALIGARRDVGTQGSRAHVVPRGNLGRRIVGRLELEGFFFLTGSGGGS